MLYFADPFLFVFNLNVSRTVFYNRKLKLNEVNFQLVVLIISGHAYFFPSSYS